MDNNYKLVLLCGVCFISGIVVTLVVIDVFVNSIGNAFHIESVNTTISLNQSMIMDAIEKMNQSRQAIP
jgi:hypothetical protein